MSDHPSEDNWYQLEAAAVLQELDSNADQGLSDAEVSARREKYGPNELVERGGKSAWAILLEQLTGIMTIILLVSAVISYFVGDLKDAIAILAIVVLNTILGFSQEYRAEKAMEALKKMATPRVRVRRGGHIREVPSQELVPGDVVLLEAGNSVPADARLIDSANLRVQEAVLTGESEPVEKNTTPIQKENLSLGDRHNTVYMGTIITYGRGSAVVTGTGMGTQLGKIAEMLQSVGQEATPLQKRLAQLGKGLALAAMVIVVIVFALGLLRGEDIRLMLLTAISMAVAAVPEGLPTVVTIGLSIGAQRMLKRNALIRKLPAVETLGSVTVICSDKTGTLTENRMTVTVLDVPGHRLDLTERLRSFSPTVGPQDEAEAVLTEHPSLPAMLVGAALSNDATLEPGTDEQGGGFTAVGDPTEGALVIAAARAGLWKSELEKALPRVAELPFDSDRKRMTTVHRVESLLPQVEPLLEDSPTSFIAFTKGAIDGLLQVASGVWADNHCEPLTDEWRRRVLDANEKLAMNGMRVLGVAYRMRATDRIDEGSDPLEKDLTILGLIGMIDPARGEVRDAVRVAQEAGIRPVMITGDHPLTAVYIARELGIAQKDGAPHGTSGQHVITGAELEKMSIDELEAQVESVPVYARVSPEHKLKIVQALQDKGHVVAMTGDGVNDAPALKKADIGVAMGITGTDVSKEAADMVLLDDNFATIVAAVEEGRRIYANIRKFMRYTLTSNLGEIWVMLLAPFLGMPMALLPLQILWVNLVTDGLPGLALTVEPAEKDTMRRPPISPNENIFGRGLVRDTMLIGLILGLVSLGMGYWAWSTGREDWQTMVFNTLTLAQMGNALASRSERESSFRMGLFSNRALIGAVLLTFLLQLAVIYIPFLQNIFKTVALPALDLAISVGTAFAVFLLIELMKAIIRTREDRREAAAQAA